MLRSRNAANTAVDGAIRPQGTAGLAVPSSIIFDAKCSLPTMEVQCCGANDEPSLAHSEILIANFRNSRLEECTIQNIDSLM